ncbi:protein FAM200A [Cryptotermes secundus]|nr:protein FAM200A [Cryptotermes secundus]
MELKSLETCTKGIDIFNALDNVVSKYGGLEKCSGIATDGAKAMVGHRSGLVGLCKEKGIHCLFFHCIIHQEALSGKIIGPSETMKTVVNTVNLIRGGKKAQRHRAFIAFLDNLEAVYGDISLYCEVRWLRAGNCLQQMFGLRNEILAFLRNENIGHEYQENPKEILFLNNFAFLTDLTSHLNALNLKLQGKKQNISQLYGHIEGFRKQLDVMQIALKSNNTAHFPSCQKLK